MTKAYDSALRLLCRREHGAQELVNKLVQKGYEQDEARKALERCQELDLQSDARFAEIVCRVRIRQGYGPLRITQELQSKQINQELINKVLRAESENWLSYALAVWEKKYPDEATSFADMQKRKRFLLYRGFPVEVIDRLVREIA